MRRNRLPDNRLDIVVPILDQKARVNPFSHIHHGYPVGQTYLYHITPKAPHSIRKATEIIACYFRREFNYDSPGYGVGEDTGEKDHVLLLAQEVDCIDEQAIGAIVFRWRGTKFALAWVWIHPFLRRQGILAAYWPTFRERFGDFALEPPVSPAMQAFVRKMRKLHDGKTR